jgi:ABC-type cobalt transport system substrate-binding protein
MPTFLGRLAAALTLVAAVSAVPTDAAANAAPSPSDISTALRTESVFVHPDAEQSLSDDEAAELLQQVEDSPTPIFVAVVPAASAESAGDVEALLRSIQSGVGRDGTYALIAGNSFRAGSTELPQAKSIATESFDQHSGDGAFAVLTAFVERISTATVGESTGSGTGSQTGSETGTSATPVKDDSDDGIGAGTVLLGVGAIAIGAFAWRRSKRKRAEAAESKRADEADRQMLRAELSVLADDVVRLEPEILLKPEAQSDFDSAVNRYRAAEAALQYADQPLDLVRVERVIDEARYSMDRVKARLAGRPLPEPPVTLQQPGRHGEPAIALDDQYQPTYVGYPGGYGGGWFGGGGGGGLFSGLLLGSMLGGGFGGWGHGYGDTTINNNYGGDGGGGGWDGGGGGFGGGDFGGGDFGGGDFGGGDFGGGDF